MISLYYILPLTLLYSISSIPVSTPATWVGSANYSSGTFKVYNHSGQLTITYQKPFPQPPQKMLVGVISQIASTTSLNYNVSNTLVSNNQVYGIIKYFIDHTLSFAEFSFRWLVISKSYTEISCNRGIGIVNGDNCTILKTGYGERVCTRNPNATSGSGQSFNLTHTNVILVWFDALVMKTIAGQKFQFYWESYISSQTNYIIKLTVYGNTTISRMTFARLTYDQTSIQNSQTVYLDGGYLDSTAGNYSKLSRTFLYKNLTSFMVGLSYFIIDSAEVLNWTFDVDSVSTSGAMNFHSMGIMYWNYRYRICDPIYPYYNETDNMCYDLCNFYYYQNEDLKTCDPCHYSCLNCGNNTQSDCTNCSENDHRTLSGNECLCNNGYYDDDISECATCFYTCFTCIESSRCDTCPNFNTAHRVLDDGKCLCADPYFDSGNTICSTCINTIPPCLICTASTICIKCDESLFYTLDGSGGCICKSGFYEHSQPESDNQCLTKCGDKILVKQFQQCDDGNNIEKDGCSSDCRIQPNFKCRQVLAYSECSYIGILNFTLLTFQKDPYSNTLIFKFNVEPELSTLDYLNFSEIIHPNLPVDNISYTYSNGILLISYEFNSSLDKQQMIFSITPSTNPNFTQSANITIQIPMILQTNQPIIPYSNQTYQNRKGFEKIYTVAMVGCYLTMILSIFTNKIVGLEMMGVLQIAFFALADYDFLHPLMAPLSPMKYVNGYNYKIEKSNKGVPIPLRAIDYNEFYFSNVNIMLLLPVLYLLTSLSLYFIGKLKDSKNKQNIFKWSKHMLKQYFLAGVMFSTYNIAFSTGLQIKYSHSSITDIMVNIISFILIIAVLYLLLFKNDKHFGEFNRKFKLTLFPRHYMFISILYRFITGFLISHQHHNPNITVINTFLAIIFLLYQIVDLPFNEGYQNYRTLFCQSSTIVILFIAMYYRSMKINVPIQVKGYLLDAAYLKVIAIILTIVISFTILCYEIIESARKIARRFQEKDNIENKALRKKSEGRDGDGGHEITLDSII